MTVTALTELISTLGFPIAIVIALVWFVYKIYKDTTASSKAREEKLYKCIQENQEINAKAMETLSLYAERLGVIEKDIKDIKTDITILTTQ